MAENYDPWETETGLAGFESFTFKGVRFATDAEYPKNAPGTVTLLIAEDAIGVDEEGQTTETRQFWSCGKGWEPAQGGKSAKHDTKAHPKFNSNSAVGMLLNEARKVYPEITKRGSPTDASTWEGLQFKMEVKEFSFKDESGQDVPYTRLLPVEFLGESGAKKTPAKRASKKVAETGGDAETNGAVPAAVNVKLKKLAKTITAAEGDYDQFLEDAYDIEGVDGEPVVEGALEGIWEAAQE